MPPADIMSCSLGWSGYPFTRAISGTGKLIAEMDDDRPLPKRAVQANPYYVEFRKDGVPSIQAHGGP